MSATLPILNQLSAVIEDRRRQLPENSYTTSLFRGGLSRIARKLTEETGEVLEAAAESEPDGRPHLIHEAADLVYHLLVLLAYRDVPWSEIEAELGRRFGVSGLDEKAARTAERKSPEARAS